MKRAEVPDCEIKKRRIGVWRRNRSMYVSLVGEVIREKSKADLASLQDEDFLRSKGGFFNFTPPVPAIGDKSTKDWGLPQSVVLALARQGIHSLYDWQDECLRAMHAHAISCVIYSAPTSGGKSLVADIALLRRLIFSGKRALLVCPFVSICRERANFLRKILAPCGIVVEEFHGPVGKPWHPGVDIAVCTVQKAMSILHHLIAPFESTDDNTRKFSELIGTVVVDEFHLVAENTAMESFVSRLSLLPDRDKLLLIGMTATLPSDGETKIRHWLGDKACLMYRCDFRPVELSILTKRGTNITNTATGNGRELETFFDAKIDKDFFASLVAESLSQSIPTVVFCATRNWCENAAALLTRLLPFSTDHAIISKRSEIVETLRVLSPCGLNPILSTSLIGGVAFHHAGLTSEERLIIETAFREKIILVLCATSTLSAGVNLPAERVILRTISAAASGSATCTASSVSAKMKQMVGRAGRAGQASKGEAIVMVSSLKEEELVREVFSSKNLAPPETVPDVKWTAKEILEIAIFFKITRMDFFKREYLRSKLFLTCEVVEKAIEFLVSSKLVALIEKDSLLIPSCIGDALAHSAMPADEAELVFAELNLARQKLCLSGDDIHLLFLVTPPVSVTETEFDEFLNSALSSCMQSKEVRGILADHDSLARRKRMMVALMLRDLTSMEATIGEISLKYGVQTGTVQYLQANAATYCAMVSSFCERLQWTSLAAALNSVKPRLHFGVPDELLPLVEVEGVSPGRAKALLKAGFVSVEKIARASALEITSVLARSAPGLVVSSETAQTLLNLTSRMIIKNARVKLGLDEEDEMFVGVLSPVSPPVLHQLIGTQRSDSNDTYTGEEDELFLQALVEIDVESTQIQQSQSAARKRRRISEMTTVDAREMRRSNNTAVEYEDFGFDSLVLKAIDFNSF